MAGMHLFSVKTQHDMLKLPYFGPFISATAAGQAVDRLLARFSDLSVQIHVLEDAQIGADELEEMLRLCAEQVEDACQEQAFLSVIEPLRSVVEVPPREEAVQLAADLGIDADALGYLKGDAGYVLFIVHMVTTDLQKAMTAVRWRRRELAGTVKETDPVIVTIPIPLLPG